MSNIGSSSVILYSDLQATLNNGSSIDSGWLDMQAFDKVQFSGYASTAGMTMLIESKSTSGGSTQLSTPVTYNEGVFYLFNVICRQRFMKFTWTNNTGVGVTDASMEIKAFKGASDKLSVFPLSVNPTDFSQAALVQSVTRGRQPDGDYVSTPADGSAFSTSANLGIGASVSTGWVDTDGWADIQIFINADQPSASRGVLIEFTDDANIGSPVTRASQTFSFTEKDIERGFLRLNLEPLLDGIKVTYTNGATAQTSFFFEIALRVTSQPNNRNEAGALLVSDFKTEVALNNVPNYEVDTKFGRNPVINIASAPSDITSVGGVYAGHPLSYTPETVNVFSSSANDTSAGTGARTVRIYGLKTDLSENYEYEDIILNGVTPVTSTNTWWRVNRIVVLTAGTGGSNAGTITARATTTTTYVFATIAIGLNQSTVCTYTVPYNKRMLIKKIQAGITRASGAAGSATISLRVRPKSGVYNAKRVYGLQTGAILNNEFGGGIVAEAGADIKVTVDAVSDNATIAQAEFEYILIEI